MNEIRFDARTTQRDFHWAWYLVPVGSVALVLLSVNLLTLPGEGPAPILAANVIQMTSKTIAAAPALAAKPIDGRPALAAGSEIAEQPPTF